jgi:hypothetical protein
MGIGESGFEAAVVEMRGHVTQQSQAWTTSSSALFHSASWLTPPSICSSAFEETIPLVFQTLDRWLEGTSQFEQKEPKTLPPQRLEYRKWKLQPVPGRFEHSRNQQMESVLPPRATANLRQPADYNRERALQAVTRLREAQARQRNNEAPTRNEWKIISFAFRLPLCILFWLVRLLVRPPKANHSVVSPRPVRETPETKMASQPEISPMAALQAELSNRKKVGLRNAVKETDQIIALLESAREKVGEGTYYPAGGPRPSLIANSRQRQISIPCHSS